MKPSFACLLINKLQRHQYKDYISERVKIRRAIQERALILLTYVRLYYFTAEEKVVTQGFHGPHETNINR